MEFLVECIKYGTIGDWKVAIEASVAQSLINGSLAGNDALYNVQWISYDTSVSIHLC